MATLAEIRAKLLAASQQGSGSTRPSGGDNALFPHWNAPDNSTTTVRFLPDGDKSNSYFWVERGVIKMPFAGIAGEANSKEVVVEVPCMENWGETCPVVQEARGFYKLAKIELAKGDKAKSDEYDALGSTYWKKKTYLMQGFVVDTKLVEDNLPENPIRRFVISPQIYPFISQSLLQPDIEEIPTDYVRGLDFKITKTTKPGGKFADYNTSGWARRERALSDVEMAAINQYGLFDLKSFLPKKPTEVELKVIMEMLEASLAGEAYDMDRWGQYYKPRGNRSNNKFQSSDESVDVTSLATSAPVQKSAPVVETVPAEEAAPPFNEPTADSNNDAAKRAQDILAKIRNRNAQ
jgi:hypothetical protein